MKSVLIARTPRVLHGKRRIRSSKRKGLTETTLKENRVTMFDEETMGQAAVAERRYKSHIRKLQFLMLLSNRIALHIKAFPGCPLERRHLFHVQRAKYPVASIGQFCTKLLGFNRCAFVHATEASEVPRSLRVNYFSAKLSSR